MSLEDLEILKYVSVDSTLVAEPGVPNVLNIGQGKGLLWGITFYDADTAAINEFCRIIVDDVNTGVIALGDLAVTAQAVILRELLANGTLTFFNPADWMQLLPIKFSKQLRISTWRSAAGVTGLRCRVLYAIVIQ